MNQTRASLKIKIFASAGTLALNVFILGLHSLAHAAVPPGGRKVIRLDAVKVEGKMQKPQAFYVLQRSSLNFEGLELKQSFIPKIIKSVEDKPF